MEAFHWRNAAMANEKKANTLVDELKQIRMERQKYFYISFHPLLLLMFWVYD